MFSENCDKCGKKVVNTAYMVHDELWKETGLDGWVCILCFEKSIGRRIKLTDLKEEVLCNHMLPVGWFMGNREFGKMK